MQTALIINATDANDKALQKTVTFVNADCSASVLKTAAQKLNSLTTNTYVKSMRIDKINVDTASDKADRAVTLSFGDNSAHAVDLSSNVINTTIADAFRADNARIPFFCVSNTDTSVKEQALLTISDISTTGTSVALFQSSITVRPAQNDFRWEFLMGAKETQTIQFTLALIGTDTFQPWSHSFTMIIGGE